MSLLYPTSEKADVKHTDYSDYSDYSDYTDYAFIFALFVMVLALVGASAIFTPVAVGSGLTSEITSVGP